MYAWLGLLLGLAGFLACNLALSAVAALVGSALRRPARANLLMALRLAPAVGSTVFVLGLLLPSYLVFEPRGGVEVPGAGLLAGALLSALLLLAAGYRGWARHRATRQRIRAWQAEAPAIERGPLTLHPVTDSFPTVSVAGSSRRPHVFVARQVLDSLSEGELEVVLAHERAHAERHDNLKRWVVESAPDLLFLFGGGRRLERLWRGACELSADAAAVRGEKARALDLGAALLSVARLVPTGRASSLVAFHDGSDVTDRVRCLLTGAPPAEAEVSSPAAAFLLGSLFLLTAAAAATPLLGTVHEASEILLRVLS